jgi:hypothetical protein
VDFQQAGSNVVTARKVSHERRRAGQSSFSLVFYETHYFGKRSVLPLLALTIWSLPMRAVDQIQVDWSKVCMAAGGKQLTILGIVAVPAALAWRAVSAPFCLLGDLTYTAGTQEIKVI